MTYLFLLISLLTLLMCSTQATMQNAIWKYDYGNGRLDELKFVEQNYIQYSAEIGEHYYGTYEINGDTIIMHQERGEFDYEFKEGSRHRAGVCTFKMLLKNGNQLGYIYNWQEGHWVDEYFFSPVNSKSE